MGFDVTASHVIWLLAILGVFGTAAGAFFTASEARVDAREAREVLVRERLHGRLDEGWFCHDAGTQTLRVHALNAGRVTLALAEVTFVVDGVVTGGFTGEPEGATGSDLWPPGEEADFRATGVAAEPEAVVLFTARGLAHFPEKRDDCPILTTIALAPSSASMQIGGAQTFTAQGLDQFGEAYDVPSFTWSSGGAGTLATLNATAVTLTAGTVSGTYAFTASYGGVTGTAPVTIHPGAPATLAVSPEVAGVPAGGAATFTATARDAYGNVNATAAISWTTDAGAITGGGVLTAQTTPATGRVVTAATGALSATAAVDVHPGPVATVTVSPATATLRLNQTATFAATARDAHGNANATPAVAWSATGGSITGGGIFTAPATTGTVTVTATVEGQQGTATVTVVRAAHVDAMATYKNGAASTTFRKGADTVEVRTTVKDHEGVLVAGASVTVEYVDSNGNVAATRTATTGASGVASVTYALPNNAAMNGWIARVTTLAGTGLTYDSAANVVVQVSFTVNP